MQSTCTIHLQDDLGNNYTINNVPFSPDHGVDESIDVAMCFTRSATEPQRTFKLILLTMNQTVLTMSASDEEDHSPTIYERKGYNTREMYLAALAAEYNVELEHVKAVADALGPNEDFDGLVVILEDHLDA